MNAHRMLFVVAYIMCPYVCQFTRIPRINSYGRLKVIKLTLKDMSKIITRMQKLKI